MKKIINLLGIIVLVLSVLFVGWFFISYIEIIIKNIGSNPQYWNWNLFEVFFK